MAPSVAIIVLNWNNARDTLACLASLAYVQYPVYRVLVVDNGSTDDSVAQIRAVYPDTALLETGANLGYAGGNNVGIRRALEQGADYVCVLNNDVLVDAGFLDGLVAVLEAQDRVGVATPLIADAHSCDCVWALGAGVARRTGRVIRLGAGAPISKLSCAEPHQVQIAPGAAWLARRDLFDQGLYMDESYFLYYEEADWSMRLAQRGFGIMAVPRSLVWHKVSAALTPSSPIVDYYMTRNRLRFVWRHWRGSSRSQVVVSVLAAELGVVLAYTLKPHGGARRAHRQARMIGLCDALLGRDGPIPASARLAAGVRQ